MPLMGLKDPLHCKLSGHRTVVLIEEDIWPFEVAHQGYLHLRTDRPSPNQIAWGARAIGISNTADACSESGHWSYDWTVISNLL